MYAVKDGHVIYLSISVAKAQLHMLRKIMQSMYYLLLFKIRNDIFVEFARVKKDWITFLSSEKKIHKIHKMEDSM